MGNKMDENKTRNERIINDLQVIRKELLKKLSTGRDVDDEDYLTGRLSGISLAISIIEDIPRETKKIP